jgi:hypothetical protein
MSEKAYRHALLLGPGGYRKLGFNSRRAWKRYQREARRKGVRALCMSCSQALWSDAREVGKGCLFVLGG